MSDESQRTILLVEDEVISAMAEKMTLENYGNKVLTAFSGEEAVETVENNPAIDLVLMDINLEGGIDGTEAAEIILKKHDLPVVFLSGHTEADVVGKTEKITSYGYIVKSSGSTVLDASIKMAFKLFEAKTKEKVKESQRKAALEALRESEEKYRTVADFTYDWEAWRAPDGTYRYVSPSCERISGYSAAEFMADADLMIRITHPADQAFIIEHFRATAHENQKRDLEFDFRILTAKGETRWISHSCTAVYGEGGRWLGRRESNRDITERKRIEEALKINEALFREFYDNMKSGSVIFAVTNDGNKGSDYIVEKMNNAGLKMEGKTLAEVAGKKFSDIRPAIDSYGLIPLMKKVWETGESAILSTKMYADERFANYYENYIFKLPSGEVVTLYNDVTNSKKAEADLRESEEMFREMAEQLEDVLFKTDNYGTITYISPSASRVFGWLPGEMIGRNFVEFLPESEIPKALQAFQATISTGQPKRNLVLRMKRKDSSVFFGELKGSPLDKKRSGTGTLGLIHDISERKLAEEEGQRQLAEKVILLKEVHHRIKNNIASIAGLLSMQAQAVTNPEAGAVLHEAIGRVVSMQILYDQLLLSESYKDSSAKNYVEGIVASVLALFPGNAEVTIDQRIADFQLDTKQLSPLGIIINELLTNIMKHAFAGRKKGTIAISLARVHGRVTLTVQDNGRGLPAGFDLAKSTGLGLMLVKLLSQQLGGSFSLERHAGTHCRVEFNA